MLILLLQLFQLFAYFMYIIIVTQVILSLLVAFNVLSMSNQLVAAVYQAVSAILDPFLKPIRKIMPDTGAIDFSPMVLLLVLQGVAKIIEYLILQQAGFS